MLSKDEMDSEMITIVSGIPRSGTSMMMQMLSAGGMAALTDGVRVPDANNPRGYFEWTPIKSLAKNPDIIAAAEGKVVKVISWLLKNLSTQHNYRIIFMRRPLEEVIASQNRMLELLGMEVPPGPMKSVIVDFQKHLESTQVWLAQQKNMTVLFYDYAGVVEKPHDAARAISLFVGQDLDLEAMAKQVEGSLYREKAPTVQIPLAANIEPSEAGP